MFRPQLQPLTPVPVLIFDIKALDDFFLGLRTGDSLCITGPQEGLIVNRLCVRALLPRRCGGLDSSVLFLDCGNNSDVYQCVNFARQYGLDIKKVLDGIIVSRAFTIYQLAELVVNELPKAIKKFGTRTVVVSGLLTMFLQDPAVDQMETKYLLRVILTAIQKVLAEVIMIVTVKEVSIYGEIISHFNNLIEISGSANRFVIKAYNNRREIAFSLPEKELRLV